MIRWIQIIILGLCIQFDLLGQTEPSAILQFTKSDSLAVEWINGQRYLKHQLKKGETLYKICKFYAVEISDLYFNNPSLEVNNLKIGQLIRIPLPRIALKTDGLMAEELKKWVPVYYKTKPKETLYRIAKTYFQMSVDVLKNRNKLTSNALNEGQYLKVGWISRTGIADSLQRNMILTGILGEESSTNEQHYKKAYTGNNEQLAEGIACWDKQMQLSAKNKLYVMSSIVPKGSYIRVDNPMTRRHLYAKVIASKPDNNFTKEALVVLTPTVAKALGGLDSRFFVRIFYCQNNRAN